MITDNIRGKNLRAHNMLSLIEHMEKSGKYDMETLEYIARKVSATAFIEQSNPGSNLLSNYSVNEPFEVALLLQDLNHLINTLSKLSDSDYYLDYIFNGGTAINEGVQALGITEDYLMGLEDKFSKLRSLLYGDRLDWDEVGIALMQNAAYSLNEDNKRLEDWNRKLEHTAKSKEGK